jgi:hypothetical protein
MKTQESRKVKSKNRFHSTLPGEHLVPNMQHLFFHANLKRPPMLHLHHHHHHHPSTRGRANIPLASPSRLYSSDIVAPTPRSIGGNTNQTRRDYSKWYDQYDTDKPNKSIADKYAFTLPKSRLEDKMGIMFRNKVVKERIIHQWKFKRRNFQFDSRYHPPQLEKANEFG